MVLASPLPYPFRTARAVWIMISVRLAGSSQLPAGHIFALTEPPIDPCNTLYFQQGEEGEATVKT